MKNRIFIYDCNGEIVGNPKGYRTLRGAHIQATSTKSKVFREIWKRFENRTDKENREVWSIK